MVNTRQWPNAGSALVYRLRRWANIGPLSRIVNRVNQMRSVLADLFHIDAFSKIDFFLGDHIKNEKGRIMWSDSSSHEM